MSLIQRLTIRAGYRLSRNYNSAAYEVEAEVVIPDDDDLDSALKGLSDFVEEKAIEGVNRCAGNLPSK